MAYQVLARKWRPKNFEQLMGQEHVVTVLVNALKQNRLHHAYLFTGTRGVGKTTIARIFAKSLNCEKGISATPCGQCDICRDIDQGRFVDLLEIDAASKTKVDDTRDILDNVQYLPTRGRFKVYLIDEVHMLSRHSFNALLKTLEEPPAHAKFILATTDPQKLPVTVLSRCLQFHLKLLTPKQIVQQLTKILTAENVSFEINAIKLIAKAARGSIRDSLSLTDQAIAQGEGHISLKPVEQMLGGVEDIWVFKILFFLIKQESQNLMSLSLEIASYAPSYSRLFADLIQLIHQVAMAQIVERQFDLSPEKAHLLTDFAKIMSPENVQLYYQIVLNGRKDLPYAADEQAAFDMVILRLLAFKPMTNRDVLKTNSKNIESNVDNKILAELSIDELSINELKQTTHSVENTQKLKNKNDATYALKDNIKKTEVNSQNVVDNMRSEMSQTVDVSVDKNIDHLQNSNLVSDVNIILAERNVLRSRRKKQEKQTKKSNDAGKRQPLDLKDTFVEKLDIESPTVTSSSDISINETKALPPFDPKYIDPAIIRNAEQVDKWAKMIDSMALDGRLKQLAIHAMIDEKSTESQLYLNLDKNTKHLLNDNVFMQLEQKLSKLVGHGITVELNVVDDTQSNPFQIQGHIDNKRFEYVQNILFKDEIVIALQQEYQAVIISGSIKAL